MHIAVNAIPIKPSGGLTVLLGVLRGLRKAADSTMELTVYASATDTIAAVRQTGCADRLEVILQDASEGPLFLWQNLRFGGQLRRHRVDTLLTVNHYLSNVSCPQIVYHLNLRRFWNGNYEQETRERFKERIRDWTARRALRKAKMNVFESRFLMECAMGFEPHIERDGIVSYIGLPDELIHQAYSDDIYQGDPLLLAISNPNDHKDNPTLIRTLAELVRREPQTDWQLGIAGGLNPAEWLPLHRLADKLGVAERVSWHGFCDHETLDALLRRSLCLVSASVLESFAMVALEAMARRCPAVVTNVTSMPESVGNAGILVPPHDPLAFADAVQRIHQKPELRAEVVARGVDWIQQFRWSRCGSEFANICRRAAA